MEKLLFTTTLAGPDGEQLQGEVRDIGYDMPVRVAPAQPVAVSNPLHIMRLSVVDERDKLVFAIDMRAERDALPSAGQALVDDAKRRLRQRDYDLDGRYSMA